MKIKVYVHLNSKKPRIEKQVSGDLHVFVNKPPVEGLANKAVVLSLSEYFKVPKSKITLLKGQKSKIKTFEINE